MKKYIFLFLLLSQFRNSTAQHNIGSIHLNGTPEPISAAMGNIGVATDPNEMGHFWNPAKLALLEANYGGSLSYSPAQIGKTIYGSIYKQVDDNMAVGLGLNYYSLGSINLRDGIGTSLGTQNPNEFGIDLALSKKFGVDFAVGATVRYIRSDVFDVENAGKVKSANATAIDVGLFKKHRIGYNILNVGFMISNIGTKLNYGTGTTKFLPTSLKTGVNYQIGQLNRFNIGLEVSKLLVSTTATSQTSVLSAMFSSFNEGLKNCSLGFGTEYILLGQVSLRSGINIQNNGAFTRKQASVGFGFIKDAIRLNASYHIPIDSQPLNNKFKFSLGMMF
jgi:hypothetical protein